MPFKRELDRIGRTMSMWEAELKFCFWGAGILGCLWVFTFSDTYIQFSKFGRIVSWLILVGMIIMMFRQTTKILAKKYSTMGIASAVEQAFPQLDNHFINFLQFSTMRTDDPFIKAYVKRGVPEWNKIKLGDMKNRKAHMKSTATLGLAAFMLVAPLFVSGKTWGTSVWRIVNPFSGTKPVSVTKILDVSPGTQTVMVGQPITMECKVLGKKSHGVWLDVKPADNEKTIYNLGSLRKEKEEQTFPHRIGKVTTDFKYRFRAGDAPAGDWYKVKTRPELAFTKITLKVTPPKYTYESVEVYDGLADEMVIPAGSKVDATVECNLPLKSTSMKFASVLSQLNGSGGSTIWKGSTVIEKGNMFTFTVANEYNEKKEATVNYQITPDKPPTISILSPRGRAILPSGGTPSIQFTALDDYGLKDVWVEQVSLGTLKEEKGKILKKWPVDEDKVIDDQWTHEGRSIKPGEPVAYRIVARDNRPNSDELIKSASIVFDSLKEGETSENIAVSYAKTSESLGQIINLQRDNIALTENLSESVDTSSEAQWKICVDNQSKIRKLTEAILKDPINPLGGLKRTVQTLYAEEMFDVIGALKSVPTMDETRQVNQSEKCLAMENKILRTIAHADTASDKTEMKKKVSHLFGLLVSMIKSEKSIITATEKCVKDGGSIDPDIIDQQDYVADDAANFAAACKREATVLSTSASDANFVASLKKIAELVPSARADMVSAAEKLDSGKASTAVPPERSALTKLNAMAAAFNQMQNTETEQELEVMADAIHDMRDKFGKLASLQSRVVDSMKQAIGMEDADTKDVDLLEEDLAEEMKELKKNMESALVVPKDLQAFAELPVANEMVEDVFEVFQETTGYEKDLAGTLEKDGEVTEMGLLAAEGLLDTMEEAEGSLDKIETWLSESGVDEVAWTGENFEKDEMAFMALGDMNTEADSLIGELTQEADEIQPEAQNEFSNQAFSDAEPGWEIAEGSMTSFAAKGDPGNQIPSHHEQDGRGNIGREGMSSGENAGGSGTIGEGDPNIEERFTPEPVQSGQANVDGEATTAATGGGKLGSGSADGVGQAGDGSQSRLDSTAEGDLEGMKSLMAKAEGMRIKASLKGLRSDSLERAAHHLRQAMDAEAEGRPINAIKQHQKLAAQYLKTAKTDLNQTAVGTISTEKTELEINDVVDTGTDEAPEEFKTLVSEYYKSLNDFN